MKKQKPISFKVQRSKSKALLVQVDEYPYFYDHLHYHPEFQITAVCKGDGILYGGNSMTEFAEGDVFMIGSNVPHLIQCSPKYYADDSPGVKGVSLIFDQLSFGKAFFDIEELKALKLVMKDSQRVIKITGKVKEKIFNKIVETESTQDESLIISFLEILSLISKSQKQFINGEQYNLVLNNADEERLNAVIGFTFKNFKDEITIDQVAKIAFLSRSQFSNFFKLHTRKTYIQFLNELRIENACIQLKGSSYPIEQICYSVGFKNVSNFVRHFKKIKGATPSQFRKFWSK